MEAGREDETEHAEKPPRWRRWLVPLLGFCLFSAIAVIADKAFDKWLPEERIVEYLDHVRDDLEIGLEQFSPAGIWSTFQGVAQCQVSQSLLDSECVQRGVQGLISKIFTFGGQWINNNPLTYVAYFLRPFAALIDAVIQTFQNLKSWEAVILIQLQILISVWLVVQWYAIPRIRSDMPVKALFWSPFLIVLYSYAIGCVIYAILLVAHWILVLATGYIGGFCAAVLPERVRSPIDDRAEKLMDWLKEWLEHVF